MEKLTYQRHIIGIAGPKGVGKSWVANRLCENVIGGSIYSFADPIRDALKAFGVCFDHKEKIQHPFGKTPRQMAQTFGTEWARGMVKDSLFIDLMEDRILSTGEHVIIDDVRFDNEAQAIKDLGGYVFRLNGVSCYEGGDRHASERGITDGLVDLDVHNPLGSPNAAALKIATHLSDVR